MTCPRCGSRMRTENTRTPSVAEVRRRRICPTCDHRVTTIELPLPELRILRADVDHAETA